RRAEAMYESNVVGLPLSLHLAKDREILRVARADSAAQLAAPGGYQTVKWTGLPIGSGFADIRRAIFDGSRLLAAIAPPTKYAALVDWMQRVDEKHCARERDACAAAPVAETVQRLRL